MTEPGKFTASLITLPGFLVAGLQIRTSSQQGEIPALWARFVPRMGEIPNQTGEHVSYGAMRNYDPQTHEFDYLACVPITRADAQPDEMAVWEIPPQTYVAVDCLLNTIQAAYGFLQEAWLPTSGYERAAGPELERYDARFQPQAGEPLLSVLIPVQPV